MPETRVAYLQAKLVTDRKRRIPDHTAVSTIPWGPFTSDAKPELCVSAGKSEGQPLGRGFVIR